MLEGKNAIITLSVMAGLFVVGMIVSIIIWNVKCDDTNPPIDTNLRGPDVIIR